MMTTTEFLSKEEWQQKADSHFQRVFSFSQAARDRHARREKHPIYDFVSKYYPFKFGKLEKWHPTLGVTLADAELPHFTERYYSAGREGKFLDPSKLQEKEVTRHQFTKVLLENTQSRKGIFGCFGLHEWAMVYSGADVRHRESAPFRLSQQEIDEVVKSRSIICSHFDAFRFFAPETQPMNKLQPDLKSRDQFEQPACIHANMDLYKWAFKSMPWIGSELLWKTFQLAIEAREIDMRASPYDLQEWGYEPICIETEAGRTLYEKEQRALAEKGKVLRLSLIESLEQLLGNKISSFRS